MFWRATRGKVTFRARDKPRSNSRTQHSRSHPISSLSSSQKCQKLHINTLIFSLSFSRKILISLQRTENKRKPPQNKSRLRTCVFCLEWMWARSWREPQDECPFFVSTASCARAIQVRVEFGFWFAIKKFKLILPWKVLRSRDFSEFLLRTLFLCTVNLISSFLDFFCFVPFLLLLYFLLIYIDKNNTHLMDDDFSLFTPLSWIFFFC